MTRTAHLCLFGAPRVAALLAASALGWCSRAGAEESDAARLFREGRALVVEGRFAEACPKLEQSQRLEPRLGTQLNIAFCNERLGELATAWRVFREAASTARQERDAERERFATSRADALAPRVPQLRVRAALGADLPAIRVDDAPLPASDWGRELPLDPGEHRVTAASGGAEYWRTSVTLTEAQHAEIAVPAPPATPTAAPPDPAALETSPGAAGRFIYEVGAFVGFIAVDTNASTPDESTDTIQVTVVEDQRSLTLTCDTANCDFFSIGGSGGFVAGVTGFVGYAVRPDVGLGLRFLLGSRADEGALIALGPSASVQLDERFRVGPAVFFGTASHGDLGTVQLSSFSGSGSGSVDVRLNGSIEFGTGLGTELGLTLMDNPSGSIILQATPLILFGSNGMAWSLPVGAVYRWD